MTLLLTMHADGSRVLGTERERGMIARALAEDGVRFEHWATRPIGDVEDTASILAAYALEVERLSIEGPYPHVDVARMKPDPSDPAWLDGARAARTKFLDEHTHAEDEIRFFVDGEGAFYLRFGDRVRVVVCSEGDLIFVPAGTRHWFDMGDRPAFTAIRFFGTKDGWVASFTGDPIARAFPSLDAIRTS